jgi:hypothetical protein
MRARVQAGIAVLAVLVTAALASEVAAAASPQPQLRGVKQYLLRHTTQLRGFTAQFQAAADRYYGAARASRFDYTKLGRKPSARRDLLRLKAVWVRGNPRCSSGSSACSPCSGS